MVFIHTLHPPGLFACDSRASLVTRTREKPGRWVRGLRISLTQRRTKDNFGYTEPRSQRRNKAALARAQRERASPSAEPALPRTPRGVSPARGWPAAGPPREGPWYRLLCFRGGTSAFYSSSVKLCWSGRLARLCLWGDFIVFLLILWTYAEPIEHTHLRLFSSQI